MAGDGDHAALDRLLIDVTMVQQTKLEVQNHEKLDRAHMDGYPGEASSPGDNASLERKSGASALDLSLGKIRRRCLAIFQRRGHFSGTASGWFQAVGRCQ